MNYPATSLFQPHLLPGERLLWTGWPKQGFELRGIDLYLIPFSLLWTGLVVSFILEASKRPGGAVNLVLLLFLAIGLYTLIGRFIHDAALRRSTAYAVTDQRLLFARGSKFSSLDIERLPRLELVEHRDGTGTISFDAGPSLFSPGRSGGFDVWVPSLALASQFFRIRDPRKVYQLIRDKSARA